MSSGGHTSAQSLIATGDPYYLTFQQRLLYFLRNCRVITLRELCIKLLIRDAEAMECMLSEMATLCWIVQGCFVLKSAVVYDRNVRAGSEHVPSFISGSSGTVTSGVAGERRFIITWCLLLIFIISIMHRSCDTSA